MKSVLFVFLCALSLAGFSHAADDEIATTFTFTDPAATKVEVAGEFSNWKALPLTKNDTGAWSATLQLKPGNYGYKFIVNGSPDWIFDPANPARKFVNDIENSAISVGGVPPLPASPTKGVTVTFTHACPDAQTVHLAGEFNAWLDNVNGKVTGHDDWLLKNDGAGNWKTTIPLAPGKYKFKYVINGGDRWETDKTKPTTADENSLIEIKAVPADKLVNVIFSLADAAAQSVAVAGEFNNWTATPLQKNDAGVWTATLALKPGKYQYKYVVNGTEWKTDPANAETTTDPDGNANSVKVVPE